MDINKFLFTKTAPKKKLAVIDTLSQGELLSITYSTVLRIIKEAGQGAVSYTHLTLPTILRV